MTSMSSSNTLATANDTSSDIKCEKYLRNSHNEIIDHFSIITVIEGYEYLHFLFSSKKIDVEVKKDTNKRDLVQNCFFFFYYKLNGSDIVN